MLAVFGTRLQNLVTHERARLAYEALFFAPRLLLHCGAVAALIGLTSGCVAETRYEEARSAGQVEMGARQRAEQRLHEAEQRLASLEADLKARDQKLAAGEETLSQSKLDSDVAAKQRDEATQLVEQLRSELTRVGGDLRTFVEQKTLLEKELAAAEAKKKQLEQGDAQSAMLLRMTRDLSAALSDGLLGGDVVVDVKDGAVVLRVRRDQILGESPTASLRDAAFAAVARVMDRYQNSSLAMSAAGAGQGSEDLAAVAAALAKRGVAPARIQSRAPDPGASSSIEFAFMPTPQPDSRAPSAPQATPSERAAL